MIGSSTSASDPDNLVFGIGENGKVVSDSVELMTSLVTPIFNFHKAGST